MESHIDNERRYGRSDKSILPAPAACVRSCPSMSKLKLTSPTYQVFLSSSQSATLTSIIFNLSYVTSIFDGVRRMTLSKKNPSDTLLSPISSSRNEPLISSNNNPLPPLLPLLSLSCYCSICQSNFHNPRQLISTYDSSVSKGSRLSTPFVATNIMQSIPHSSTIKIEKKYYDNYPLTIGTLGVIVCQPTNIATLTLLSNFYFTSQSLHLLQLVELWPAQSHVCAGWCNNVQKANLYRNNFIEAIEINIFLNCALSTMAMKSLLNDNVIENSTKPVTENMYAASKLYDVIIPTQTIIEMVSMTMYITERKTGVTKYKKRDDSIRQLVKKDLLFRCLNNLCLLSIIISDEGKDIDKNSNCFYFYAMTESHGSNHHSLISCDNTVFFRITPQTKLKFIFETETNFIIRLNNREKTIFPTNVLSCLLHTTISDAMFIYPPLSLCNYNNQPQASVLSTQASIELNIAGHYHAIATLFHHAELTLHFPHHLSSISSALSPTRGVLLSGPPGVGKTAVVQSLSQTLNVPLVIIGGGDIISAHTGQSETKLKHIFQHACVLANKANATSDYHSTCNTGSKFHLRQSGCILFVDEIDVLCPRRDEGIQYFMSADLHLTRVVSTLLTLLDGNSSDKSSLVTTSRSLFIIGATNRVNSIDSALRRPGRLDVEIVLSPPTITERHQILQLYILKACQENSIRNCRKIIIDESVDLASLAKRTTGYVGADLQQIVSLTITNALSSHLQCQGSPYHNLVVSQNDFEHSLRCIVPSLRRHVLSVQYPSTLPQASGVDIWDSTIGGMTAVKNCLQKIILWPSLKQKQFQKIGLSINGALGTATIARGILLYGPPGCSKTTIVKTLCKISTVPLTLISLSASELFQSYIGEGEKLLRESFTLARNNSPSILFIDEIDAMTCNRSSGDSGDNEVSARILSTLLNEMDGIESCGNNVLIVGATNRPDKLDSALMRPGRFDKLIYIGMPDQDARRCILKIHTVNKGMNVEIDNTFTSMNEFHSLSDTDKLLHFLDNISDNCTDGLTGAEIENLCREAALRAIRRSFENTSDSAMHGGVTMDDFRWARKLVTPRVTAQQLKFFEDFID